MFYVLRALKLLSPGRLVPGGPGPLVDKLYFRPDGTSKYLRPDGTSQYLRP